MLTQIDIRNYVIVDQLAVDFDTGLSVLTGETGAGKSIVVDALTLALGDKVGGDVVRSGAARAEVCANFDIAAIPQVQQLLEELGLDEDDSCLLRRVVAREGRSRAFVNGRPTTLSVLQQLGELLVDLHGQNAHQSLLRRDFQRRLLDQYGGHTALLKELQECYQLWRAKQQLLDNLLTSADQLDARRDLLRYQVGEIEQLNPKPGEYEVESAEHRRLAHAGELLESCQRHLEQLDNDEQTAVRAQLIRAQSDLARWGEIEPRLQEATELLDTAAIQLEEATALLRDVESTSELDPRRLEYLDQRLGNYHSLARKHHCEPEALPQKFVDLSAELTNLTDSDADSEAVAAEVAELIGHYGELARQLSAHRQETAARLGAAVTKTMQSLGMPEGRFEIALLPRDSETPAATGLDQIDFRVCANPGQEPQPLSQVASGGELSRISLAIQVVTAAKGAVPTQIYDEVDVGIGGGTAEVVGQQLRQLAAKRQVICITHLPQVAAQGQHHLRVTKQLNGGAARADISPLEAEDRIEELSRMLGGVEITAQTTAHAKEMLTRAQQV